MGNILREPFGTLPDGRTVERYTLNGSGQLSVSVLTFGATVQTVRFAGRDVVLGYDTAEGYLNGNSYQGACVGRCANRIAGGSFTLSGIPYTLYCNENGVNHLHGGRCGFSHRIWNAEEVEGAEDPTLRLSLYSPDGDEGYPGNLTVNLTVTVTADDTLRLVYTAVSDADTVYAPTCHAYFNLNGREGTQDIRTHRLTLAAETYLPVDGNLIPTGEKRPVLGTPFDFLAGKPVGQDMEAEDDQLRMVGQGYDHCFMLTGQPAAVLYAPESGIWMTCTTDCPAIQVYTSNFLDEPKGKGNAPLHRHQGICLETQFPPDAVHHPDWESPVLPAGKPFRSETAFHFSLTEGDKQL